MHEVGHTLGLRHNFRGSAGVTAEELSDRSYTERHGHGVSVMDYTPPALALDSRRQGSFYSPTIGSYDSWAITYGYSEADGATTSLRRAGKGAGADNAGWTPDVEINALRAIASRAAEPGNLYASDEDAGFGGAGLDPTVSRYDMTDDPLGWAKDRVTLVDRLFDSLETRVVAPGQGYGRLRSAFTDLLSDRWYALLVSTKYLGGATTARDHRGDPDARPALATVPAARQREALAFIADAAFGERAFNFRPELLEPAGARAVDALGCLPLRAGEGGLPPARLGPGPAGLAAQPAARPRGPLQDSRRRASRAAGRTNGRHPRAVRTAYPGDLDRAGHPALDRSRALPATSGRCAATCSGFISTRWSGWW